MSIIGLDLDATRVYELKRDPDRGTPEATRFTLGTIDSRVYGKIRDKSTAFKVDPKAPDDEVETSINQEETNFETCQFGITHWDNFVDPKGVEIVFKTIKRNMKGKSYTIVDPEVLCRLPRADLSELATEISKENDVTEDDAKN